MPKKKPDPPEGDEQPDDEDETSAAERWKHDDPTETTPAQRRVNDLREHTESMIHTRRQMEKLYAEILRRLQNPWKDVA